MSARRKTAAATHRAAHAAKAGRRSSARAGGADGARGKRRPIVGVGAIVAAALVALVLVSASHSPTARTSASGAAARAAPAGGGVGSQATSFTLVGLDGRPVSAPRAGRPGVLFFSESSCSSCIPSAQALSSVRSRLGARVDAVMVDIAPTDSAQDLRQWAGLVGKPSYPLAIDTTASLASAYRLQYLGTTIFYDAQGRIVARIADPSTGDVEQGFRKAGVSL